MAQQHHEGIIPNTPQDLCESGRVDMFHPAAVEAWPVSKIRFCGSYDRSRITSRESPRSHGIQVQRAVERDPHPGDSSYPSRSPFACQKDDDPGGQLVQALMSSIIEGKKLLDIG